MSGGRGAGERLFDAIGPYRVIEPLGSGGMADVSLAIEGPDSRPRLVALKRLGSHVANADEFRRMFDDEWAIASRLHHPNIVAVLGRGQHNGAPYLALEFVFGSTLRTLMRSSAALGGIPTVVSCEIARQVAEGLAHAHSLRDETGTPLKIVHRDVSPDNVIVSFSGTAKLIDFGIAAAAQRVEETRTGMLKGKASYMSPEQAAGLPVDHRSDLFSLGVVLFEMLTGRRLFKRRTRSQTLVAVRTASVPCLKELSGPISDRVEEVVAGLLERRTSLRIQTAPAASAALGGVAAANEGQERLKRWLQSNFGTEIELERARLRGFIENKAAVTDLDPVEEIIFSDVVDSLDYGTTVPELAPMSIDDHQIVDVDEDHADRRMALPHLLDASVSSSAIALPPAQSIELLPSQVRWMRQFGAVIGRLIRFPRRQG